jgi:hypothetical protein
MGEVVPVERITTKIYLIRNIKVMLDRDLAELYQVETSQLKRAVRRHIDRFPKDFMFELTKDELENWRCQFGTSNSIKMGLRYMPMAFSERRCHAFQCLEQQKSYPCKYPDHASFYAA